MNHSEIAHPAGVDALKLDASSKRRSELLSGQRGSQQRTIQSYSGSLAACKGLRLIGVKRFS